MAGSIALISSGDISIIALLSSCGIRNAISAGGDFTTRPAAIRKCVVIEDALITGFPLIRDTVSTVRVFAGESASIRQEVTAVVTAVTLFGAIQNTIAAAGERAIKTAHIRGGIVVAGESVSTKAEITLFRILPNGIPTDERNFDLTFSVAAIAVSAHGRARPARERTAQGILRVLAARVPTGPPDADAPKVAVFIERRLKNGVAACEKLQLTGVTAPVAIARPP